MTVQSLEAFLTSQKYHFIELKLSIIGRYSVKDSEWNYSDVPHLNHVHTQVSGTTVRIQKDYISNIFNQKILFFRFPATVIMEHRCNSIHDYIMTILNICIVVRTKYSQDNAGICTTSTRYRFYHNGPVGFIVALLARIATRRNNRILMSEDLPLRYQRQSLRDVGVEFYKDSLPCIGFSDTTNISENNVDGRPSISILDQKVIKIFSCHGNLFIEYYFLWLYWNEENIFIMPAICPHEGAKLDYFNNGGICTNDKVIAKCPWHGRQVEKLICESRDSSFRTEFTHLRTRICATYKLFEYPNKGTLFLDSENP